MRRSETKPFVLGSSKEHGEAPVENCLRTDGGWAVKDGRAVNVSLAREISEQ